MWLWREEYARGGLGAIEFYQRLDPSRQRLVGEFLAKLDAAKGAMKIRGADVRVAAQRNGEPMKADRRIIQRALQRELAEADRNIGTALWKADNESYYIRRRDKTKDERATAVAAIERMQKAIEEYDAVRAQLDALESFALELQDETATERESEALLSVREAPSAPEKP